MIDKPIFNDSELICIRDAVSDHKKEFERVFAATNENIENQKEVFDEMDSIIEKCETYIKETIRLNQVMRKLEET